MPWINHENADAEMASPAVQRGGFKREFCFRHVAGEFAALACAMILLLAQSWLPFTGVQVHADTESLSVNHPSLYHDSDVVDALRTAVDSAEKRNYQDAARMFQRVIDRSLSSPTPITKGEHAWVPVNRWVEQLIREQDEGLLLQYQALVEGRVRSLMMRASGAEEEAVLSEVVSRYFLSSYGAEAAFRLGVIRLDRYAFARARTLLEKALDHPSLEIPRSDIIKRLAAVAAFEGDHEVLAAYREELEQVHEVDQDLFTRLEKIAAQDDGQRPEKLSQWPMHLGTAERHGRQGPLREAAFENTVPWTKLWQTDADYSGVGASNAGICRHVPSVSLTRGETLRRWREFGWTPSRRLHFADGHVLFKTHHYVNGDEARDHSMPALVALDINSGDVQWAVPHRPPAWITERSSERDTVRLHRADRPSSTEELLLFGDRISQEMTISDGIVYSIAGHEWHAGSGGYLSQAGTMTRSFSHFGPNSLIAVELKTGRRLWQVQGDRGNPSKDMRFVGAPLKEGETLYAPVEQHGGLYLMALDASPQELDTTCDDRVQWKVYLCSTLEAESREWSPAGMTMVDRDVFIATGRGLVFAVDGHTGTIRWAASYEQSGEVPRHPRAFAGVEHLRGWLEDIILPWGGALIVLPSDARRVLLIDQESGKLLDGTLDLQRYEGLDHLIGTTENGLVAAGNEHVHRFEITRERSRQLWARRLGPQTGRGTIAGNMILIPVEDRIYQLRLEDGEVNSSVRAAWRPGQGRASEPLGNLYSTGESLLVAGMSGVYALLDGPSRLAQLEAEIAMTGLTVDHVEERASILRAMGDPGTAADGLRGALETIRDESSMRRLQAKLLEVLIDSIRQGSDRPSELYGEAESLVDGARERSRLAWAMAAHYESNDKCSSALEYWLLVAAWGGGAVVSVDPASELDQQSLRVQAIEKIEAFIDEYPDRKAQLEEMAGRLMVQFEDEDAGVTPLLDLGLAIANTETGRRAILTGIEKLLQQQRIEEAEAVLKELAFAEAERSRLTGQVALARLYQRVGWPRLALRQWSQIESLVDCDVEVTWDAGGGRTIGEIYGERRQILNEAVEESGPVLRHDAEWRKVWREGDVPGTNHLLNPGLGDASDHLQETVLLPQRESSTLVSRGAETAAQWKMRFPESTIVNRQIGFAGGNVWAFHDHYLSDTNGRMLRDGHIGFAISQERVMAYGLVRRDAGKGQVVEPLWEVSHKGHLVHEATEPMQWPRARRGIGPYAVGAGVVALALVDDVTAVNVVRVFCTRTGHLLWQRRSGNDSIEGVSVCGPYVVTIDRSDRIEVHDRRSGAMLRAFRLEGRGSDRPVLTLNSALVYVDENDTVKRVALPGGEQQWSFDAGGRVRTMHAMPWGEAVVVTENPGGILVARLDEGERLWSVDEQTVSQLFGGGIEDATLAEDGSLVISGHDGGRVPRLVRIAPEHEAGTDGVTVNVPIGVARPLLAQGAALRADWFIAAAQMVPTVHVVGAGRGEVEVRFSSWPDGKPIEQLRLEGPEDGRFRGMTGSTVVAGPMVLLVESGGVAAYTQEVDE